MKLNITHQSTYSRGELLLRSIFGLIYIMIPHFFIMAFVSIWANILAFIAWWAVLFTGKYPKSMFEFMVKLYNWDARLSATLMNLVDGYPAIGPGGTSDKVSIEVEYPENLSRGLLIIRMLFGFVYVVIPHMVLLSLRMWASQFLTFLAWWSVLFTGKYPSNWHAFNVETLAWGYRLNLYMSYMTDKYPPLA